MGALDMLFALSSTKNMKASATTEMELQETSTPVTVSSMSSSQLTEKKLQESAIKKHLQDIAIVYAPPYELDM
ncbi:hypothetical protein ACLB2K_058846 [Fragaria x ananassa]